MDSAPVWAAFFALCSVLAVQLGSAYTAWRNRKWEAEDRERHRKKEAEDRERLARDLRAARDATSNEIVLARDRLASQLAESERSKIEALEKLATSQRDMATALRDLERDKTEALEKVAAEQREMTRVTQMKIDENTEISTRAFHEANSVNLKIKSLGVELLEGEGKPH